MRDIGRVRDVATGVRARVVGALLLPWLMLRNRFSRRPVTDDTVEVAVCLTSFGMRLRHVHLVIESIARGTTRPNELILWLSHDDMERPLPPGLRRLRARGLSVRPCDDLGSHKKYYPYAVTRSSARTTLVTADDDVYYPRSWLRLLVQAHETDRSAVWCYRARSMRFDSDGRLAPYRAWNLAFELGPSFQLVPTGVSGVLHPGSVLDEARRRGEAFLDVAPLADDLWLHSLAVSRRVPVRRLAAGPRHFPVAPSRKGGGLMATNVNGGNDEVISRLYSHVQLQQILLDRAQEGDADQ